MRVAPGPRATTLVAAVAALGAAGYLGSVRDDEVRLADARSTLQSGDLQQARDVARQVGGQAEGRAAVLAGGISVVLGDLPGAERDLRTAIERRPSDWRARRDLATVLAVRGDVQGARRQAQRTLRLNPRAVLPPAFQVRVLGR
ncbi:M48 family metallopeptidase [Conexibacter sp. SYSU D00693]|uniref:tetratricopeptide repeat protein n=1 Tax=Conexibacter sp. SYSU D00693 TaxID=2812560 RepID=UPI00196B306F|nr:tetratricopeptide repeat protein [Conexibacter sp. SYSU D00693]